MSWKTIAMLVSTLGAVLGAPWPGTIPAARADSLEIATRHVARAPQDPFDSLWNRAPSTLVPVRGRGGPEDRQETVLTKALYTDDRIFFLFQWRDPTQSTVKQSWIFDGTAWRHLPGNEDRIALLFEATRIHQFASKGCAVTCHSPPDVPREQWSLATRTPAERGDLWHWQAARTAPYGYADDAWLTVAGRPTGSYRETGRVKDAGAGGDVKNETADKSSPRYMQDPARKASVPGFLLVEEAVEIPAGTTFAAGTVIPYRLPRKPSGSRGDVAAASDYRAGTWTVMLSRKLDTGHDDDVVFDPRKRYSFAMAVFDDSGANHSKATQPLLLTFVR